MVSYAQQLTEDAKEQAGYTRAKAESDKKLVSLARQLSTSATSITAELGREQEVLKQIQSDRKLQRNIEIELSNARAQLTEEDAKAQARLTKAGQRRAVVSGKLNQITAEYNRLLAAGADPAGAVLGNLKLQQIAQEKLAAKADEEYDAAQDGISDNAKKVTNLEEQFDLSTKLIADREAELKTQKEITKATGVTGAVVEGIGGIMQRLGLRSGIFNQAMADASNEMRRIAGDAKKAKENISKTQVAAAGLAKLLGGLKGGLLDPAVIGGAVLKSFFEVNEAATELQRITGQESSEIAGMNDRLATSVDFLKVAAELTAQTGMNAQNAFSPKVIAQAAELKNTMGLTAEAAGGLAIIAQTTVGDVDGVADSVVGVTSAFNKANKSAVSQGVVLRDVAHASADIKASLSGNPEQLALAASAARRMGLELSKVDQIASSLMDFESSIEAELEAQLLTGKSINMAKARELALNNDLAGLGKEIFKNSADINEFGKMNRIQQEAQAKALGLSREELGKIAYQRAIEAGMTEEAAEAAAGVTAEDMKRLKAQEALQLAVSKLTQAFAPVLNIIGDIANGLATMITPVAKLVGLITSTSIGKVAVATFVAIRAFGGLNSVIGGSISGIKSLSKGFMDYVKNVKGSKGILEKTKAFLGIGGKGSNDKVKENVKKVQDKTSKTNKPGAKSEGGLEGLAKGLKAMGAEGVMKGIGNLVLSVIPLTLMVAAVPALMGLAAFGKAAGIGLEGLGNGLAKFGEAMKALGPQGFGYAAAGLILLTGSLIGIGYALRLAAPAFEAIGLAIKSAFEGIASIITAAAEGIASILREVTLEKAVALVAVGGGFAALGLGLASLGASLIFGVAGIGVLAGIAAMADPLSIVGTSLTAIAAGLAAMQVALDKLDTEKLEEIKNLVASTSSAAPIAAATGAITSLVNGMNGGGEGDSNSELLAEIKALRAVVEKGGNINMDGNKVGQFIMLSANKSA